MPQPCCLLPCSPASCMPGKKPLRCITASSSSTDSTPPQREGRGNQRSRALLPRIWLEVQLTPQTRPCSISAQHPTLGFATLTPISEEPPRTVHQRRYCGLGGIAFNESQCSTRTPYRTRAISKPVCQFSLSVASAQSTKLWESKAILASNCARSL